MKILSGNQRKKILITGANGFVARAVIDELTAARRYAIDGFVNRSGKSKPAGADSKFRAFEVDIADYETFPDAELLRGTDYVIHCAGLAHQFGTVAPEAFRAVNAEGTRNVCRLAARIGAERVVLASSVSVYGDHAENEVDESFECRPAGPYAESKWAAEQIAREICERHEIGLVMLRLATVTGAGDKGNVMRLITKIDCRRFLWIGKGDNKKTLIDREDAAGAISKVIENFEFDKTSGVEIYNLAAPPVAMREIVGTISRNLEKSLLPLRIPENAIRRMIGVMKKIGASKKLEGFEGTLEKWLSNDIYSGRRFYERYGFVPRKAIAESLAEEVRDYLKRKREIDQRQVETR